MNAVMNPPETEQITLYYREGSSDKVYQVRLEARGERYIVNVAYGRRGAELNTGTKTPISLDYDSAKKVFEKVVREKMAKGYTQGENGTAYQGNDHGERVSGILPQLLNPVEEPELERLIEDPGWCMQEKFDGRRVLVMKIRREVQGINKKGLTIGLPITIVKAAEELLGDFILDGEMVGETLHCFDLLALSGENLVSMPYRVRLLILDNLLEGGTDGAIRLISTAFKPEEKRQMFSDLKSSGREGVVLKRLDAFYTAGRPGSGGPQLKHKFYATCSAVVSKMNPQRSVELGLKNEEGWQVAGNVTIPPNHPIPPVGAVVEVRYLYAHRESGCLYQPVYLGERSDVEPDECLQAQLKYKPTEIEE